MYSIKQCSNDKYEILNRLSQNTDLKLKKMLCNDQIKFRVNATLSDQKGKILSKLMHRTNTE